MGMQVQIQSLFLLLLWVPGSRGGILGFVFTLAAYILGFVFTLTVKAAAKFVAAWTLKAAAKAACVNGSCFTVKAAAQIAILITTVTAAYITGFAPFSKAAASLCPIRGWAIGAAASIIPSGPLKAAAIMDKNIILKAAATSQYIKANSKFIGITEAAACLLKGIAPLNAAAELREQLSSVKAAAVTAACSHAGKAAATLTENNVPVNAAAYIVERPSAVKAAANVSYSGTSKAAATLTERGVEVKAAAKLYGSGSKLKAAATVERTNIPR
nr:CTLT [synthetic construct]